MVSVLQHLILCRIKQVLNNFPAADSQSPHFNFPPSFKIGKPIFYTFIFPSSMLFISYLISLLLTLEVGWLHL